LANKVISKHLIQLNTEDYGDAKNPEPCKQTSGSMMMEMEILSPHPSAVVAGNNDEVLGNFFI
jgi:hypothetical protein